MAHIQQLSFIKTIAQHLTSDYSDVKILEIGSYDVNGSVRNYFLDSDYLGTDLVEGPSVDLVADGHLITHKDNTYEITISCECFEHNPYWFETFINMHRMTKSGGFLIFTCATKGRLEHGTNRTSPTSSPGSQSVGWNYYHNLEEKDFEKKINLENLFENYLFLTNNDSKDLYFIGKKFGAEGRFYFDKKKFIKEYNQQQVFLKSNNSLLKKTLNFFRFLIFIPVSIASYLPQKYFHNFTVAYIKPFRYLKSKIFYLCNSKK